jgi:hypothetical protein
LIALRAVEYPFPGKPRPFQKILNKIFCAQHLAREILHATGCGINDNYPTRILTRGSPDDIIKRGARHPIALFYQFPIAACPSPQQIALMRKFKADFSRKKEALGQCAIAISNDPLSHLPGYFL